MNNSTKIRAWHFESKTMLTWGVLSSSAFCDTNLLYKVLIAKKPEYELMYSLDLEDMGIKEVFSGDIVQILESDGSIVEQGEVVWDRNSFRWTINGYGFTRQNLFRIIGNKFENPELLNEFKEKS